jgi:hypothetical protein
MTRLERRRLDHRECGGPPNTSAYLAHPKCAWNRYISLQLGYTIYTKPVLSETVEYLMELK